MREIVDGLTERLWPGRVQSIVPLSQGITNTNYVVDLGDEQVVIRIPGKNTRLLGIDRDNEVAVGRLAATIGVGPELITLDETTGCIVTRFIEGRPIPTEELAREPLLGHFVQTLRQVHTAGTVTTVFDPVGVIHHYRDEATAREVTAPFHVDEAFSLLERISNVRPMRPTVLGHNDLLNANLLYDGRIRIVDWEYAGMTDPFFDLANVAVNNGFSRDSEVDMVRHYFGEIDDSRMATLHLMKIVSELREAMWGVMQMAISSLEVDFATYATERGSHALALATDYDISDLLALAADYRSREP